MPGHRKIMYYIDGCEKEHEVSLTFLLGFKAGLAFQKEHLNAFFTMRNELSGTNNAHLDSLDDKLIFTPLWCHLIWDLFILF